MTPLACFSYGAIFTCCFASILCLVSAEVFEKYFLDCGANFSSTMNGRKWVGDSFAPNVTLRPAGVSAMTYSMNSYAPYADIYRTVRIFTTVANYSFKVNSHGHQWVRLHFYPFTFKDFTANSSVFSVNVGNLRLLSNFRISDEITMRNDIVQSERLNIFYLIKEYLIDAKSSDLVIAFVPGSGSFAFINAIEVVSLPKRLFKNSLDLIGSSSRMILHEIDSQSLETVHMRPNVGGKSIEPDNDSGGLSSTNEKLPGNRMTMHEIDSQSLEPMFRRLNVGGKPIEPENDYGGVSSNKDSLAGSHRTEEAGSPLENNKDFNLLWFAIGAGGTAIIIAAIVGLCMFFLKFVSLHSLGYFSSFMHARYVTRALKVTRNCARTNPPAQSVRKFTFTEIDVATNSFDESRIIGIGGFGKVYKGELEDGTAVAVKKANPQSEQGLTEFETEIELLSNLRHRHLVSLIGYCEDQNEMVLVYEYMANGTLRSHLFGSNFPPLSWKQRLEICIGVARGLHYLHTGAEPGIIHRDVKATNILLDENFVAKIADFGLSKTVPSVNHTHVSTIVKGSFGYLDPEYYTSQRLTDKSDVYSFGVVLFEVVCARPVIDNSLSEEQKNLAKWAQHCQQRGMLEQIVDPHLAESYSPISLKKFGHIAKRCLADDGKNRPKIGVVLRNLEDILELQEAAFQSVSVVDSSLVQLPHIPSNLPRIEDSDEDVESTHILDQDQQIDESTHIQNQDSQIEECMLVQNQHRQIEESALVQEQDQQIDESRRIQDQDRQIDESTLVQNRDQQVEESDLVQGQDQQIDERIIEELEEAAGIPNSSSAGNWATHAGLVLGFLLTFVYSMRRRWCQG